jgi:hypothetical protein
LAKPRQLARDRHRDLGRGLVVFGQAPESRTQALSRLVRDRNHMAWLSFPPTRERQTDSQPMLIMPGGFYQELADQHVGGARDTPATLMFAGRIFTRHQADIGHHARAVAKPQKSCSSAKISIAVTVSMPRKHRNNRPVRDDGCNNLG